MLIGPIRDAERSELVGVASRDAEKAKAYAKEHEIDKAYESYEALLADPEIDVVYIALPNALHAEWIVKAAEAGKHVLCEKPLVTSLEDLDRVEAAAVANKVTVFEAFMSLHHPQVATIRSMIGEGKLGRLQAFKGWLAYNLPEGANDVRLDPTLDGGALWDVGVYPNSLAITLNGGEAPVEVWAQQVEGESGVDVATVAQLKFASGFVAQISCGFRSPYHEGAQLVGEKGIVAGSWQPFLAGENCSFDFSPLEGDAESIALPGANAYLKEVEAMEACVLDGAAPVISLAQSRAFLSSALAICESAQTKSVVRL